MSGLGDIVVPLQDGWVSADQLGDIMRERGITRFTIPGTYSPEQLARMRQVRESKFFKVRNRGAERFRCRKPTHNCGGFHEFFTLMGVDQPFRGLDGALWGYTELVHDDRLASMLRSWAPRLDNSHSSFARTLREKSKEPGVEVLAFAIGVLEPISEELARSLARQINAKRPPRPFQL